MVKHDDGEQRTGSLRYAVWCVIKDGRRSGIFSQGKEIAPPPRLLKMGKKYLYCNSRVHLIYYYQGNIKLFINNHIFLQLFCFLTILTLPIV